MPDPTYEVKIKDESSDPPITPPAIDPTEVEAQATARAEEIASEKINKLKEDLATSLTGKQGRFSEGLPKTWDGLADHIEESAVAKATKLAEEKFTKILDERDKKTKEQESLTAKQTEEQQKVEWARMSQEWSEAVADGIIPDISAEVKAKLKSGTQFSALTPDEQNDPGLKAYNDARQLHVKLKQEGKSNNFYRTIDKFYTKQPAGAGAPVLGGTTPTAPSNEIDYDEIAANRKARFGF